MNPSTSADALNQLKQQQATALNPQDYLSQQENTLGVGAQRDAVTGLRGAIANTTKLLQNVAPSVAGRSANSLVNAAAQQRITANESAPISNTLNTQGQQYQTAASDLNDLQSRAAQLASAQYQGQQDKQSYLQNLYNTLYQREQTEKDRQEQIRQFNESQRAAAASGAGGYGGFDMDSIVNALQGGSKTPASTAKKYIGNDDYRGRLAYEASKGSNDAKVLLKYVGNNGVANSNALSKAEYDILKRNGVKGSYKVAANPNNAQRVSGTVVGNPNVNYKAVGSDLADAYLKRLGYK